MSDLKRILKNKPRESVFHTPEQMKFLDDWIGRLEAFRLQTHGGRRPER